MAAGFGTVCPSPAAAGAVEIAPTTIDLPSGSDTGVFYITNRGDRPIVAQVQGFAWRQTEAGDRLEPSDALTVSPPMARLAPGQQQIVRLAVTPDAASNDERAFRLLVSELPDPSEPVAQSVRVLLQFSVPVFKAGAHPSEAHLDWRAARSGDGLSLIARNTGARHVKLSGLSYAVAGERSAVLMPATFAYILPGASHRWTIPARDLKTGEPIRVTGRDDSAGAAIDASLAVVP